MHSEPRNVTKEDLLLLRCSSRNEDEKEEAFLAELGFHGAGVVEENGDGVFALAVGVDDSGEGDSVDLVNARRCPSWTPWPH